ncbi:hypothetical protein HN789_01520 [archaeon]|jgi:hypothetical protein|nr:hypothetical protein [archaeon]MBT4022210.1 hypothetical protein [archaeon]MBT4272823.1 hypothetical protein [archaeon]MBT4461623.1 hypothetical protein [archaeon]MBT4857609.1 hypothetical protein [archaeon]
MIKESKFSISSLLGLLFLILSLVVSPNAVYSTTFSLVLLCTSITIYFSSPIIQLVFNLKQDNMEKLNSKTPNETFLLIFIIFLSISLISSLFTGNLFLIGRFRAGVISINNNPSFFFTVLYCAFVVDLASIATFISINKN